jgi:hypothetical protein
MFVERPFSGGFLGLPHFFPLVQHEFASCFHGPSVNGNPSPSEELTGPEPNIGYPAISIGQMIPMGLTAGISADSGLDRLRFRECTQIRSGRH